MYGYPDLTWSEISEPRDGKDVVRGHPVRGGGAGAAGLAVSRRLSSAGVEHLVLERHDVARHLAQPAMGQLHAEHT